MIRLVWAGGEHDFTLRIGELRALQTATDCGPGYLFSKLQDGRWRVDDLLHTIRCGLIGGGMESEAAGKLVNEVADNTPLMPLTQTAFLILAAALIGEEHDPLGESKPTVVVADSPSASANTGDSPGSTSPAP